MDNLVERGHKTSEQILDLVRHEVAEQLRKIDGSSLEKLANQVADLLKRSADAGRAASSDMAAQAAKGRQGRPRRRGESTASVGEEGGDERRPRPRRSGRRKTAANTATKTAKKAANTRQGGEESAGEESPRRRQKAAPKKAPAPARPRPRRPQGAAAKKAPAAKKASS